MERLDVMVPRRPPLLVLALVALAAACGPNARQGSLAGGEAQGESGGSGDELTFPDEAEARAAPPASEEVLAGALLRDTDRVEEGVAMLREAVRVRPGFASAQLNLGLALEDSGDDEGAEAAYRSVIRLSPREPTSRTSLGLLLLRTNRRDQALIELRRAAPLAEGRADLAAIGGGLRRAGDAAMAVRVLTQAVSADEEPAPPGLRAELALAEFAAGQREPAEQHLRALISELPSYAAAHYLLANMLAAREAWAEAAREYEAYLRAEPRGADASEARGRLDYVRSRAR